MINNFDITQIMSVFQNVLPGKKELISLHEPYFGGKEWTYIKDCIDSGWVSSVGKYVDKFEKQLVDFTGAKYATAVVNGTSALHISLKLADVEQNDEVLVPAMTFIATANAVSYNGAIPHFVDIEEKTLGLDPYKLDNYLKDIAEIRQEGSYNKRTGRRIKAVVPMHTFGHPVDIDPLLEISKRFKLEIIEDAAESLGSYYKGKHTGNWGKLSVISFNGNKTVTTGGGGAILTNDEALAKQAKHLTTTAKIPHKWAFIHDEIGYNYRMPNINAALGCAQMEQLPILLDNKRNLALRYQEAFKELKGIKFFTEPDFAKSNYWLNVLLLDNEVSEYRDKLLEKTNDNGISTRPAWTLMHKLPVYKNNPRMDLSIAENIEGRLINILSSPVLGEQNNG